MSEKMVPLSSLEAVERERDEARKEIEAAKNDLRSFMTSFVREHFPDVPQWKPLPDLSGMLSQMDNASTIARDLTTRAETAEASLAAAREEGSLHVSQLSELLKLIKEHWIDYDHIFSISVHEADQWVAALAGSNGE